MPDEEVNNIVFGFPTANPLYYPRWWDCSDMFQKGDSIDKMYVSVANVISSQNPIRTAIIDSFNFLPDADNEELFVSRIREDTGEHRDIVTKMRG